MLATSESLVCVNLTKLVTIADKALFELNQENGEVKPHDFVKKLQEQKTKFWIESANPLALASVRGGSISHPTREYSGPTSIVLTHPPRLMIPCTLEWICQLTSSEEVQQEISKSVNRSSIVSPLLPEVYTQPSLSKHITITEAKKHRTDFKEFVTTELKAKLKDNGGHIQEYSEQLWLELNGFKQSQEASVRISTKIEELTSRQRHNIFWMVLRLLIRSSATKLLKQLEN